MKTRVVAAADSGHRLPFREHLRIRTNADLQILRPGAGLDQRLLEPHRSGRPRLEGAQLSSESVRDRLARSVGALPAAMRALFDDALHERLGESDAGGLERMQIDGGQQPRPVRRSRFPRRVGEDLGQEPEARAPGRVKGFGGRGLLAEVVHRRKSGADVENAIRPDRDNGWSADIRPPDPSGQGSGKAVVGQGHLFDESKRSHDCP